MSTPLWVYFLMPLLLMGGVGTIVWSLRGGGERPCGKCGKLMMPEWSQCLFCGAPTSGAANKPGLLHFVSGPPTHKDQVVALEKSVVTIGSADGNDVVLKEVGVSRKHVGIRKVDGGYELADFGSTNGVFVNGEKVPRRRLMMGDIIRVGGTEMIFRTS